MATENKQKDIAANNKRIAKNTLMLYIRMILIMAVSLYSSRVVLKYLGASDFGIYNVVGGIILMVSFITNSMGGAVSRFITFELGKEDGDVEKLFRVSSTIFYIFSIIIFLLAETIGLWFIQKQLNIPISRMNAALWVYHCSIVTFIISLISIPYNALIIAYEKMNAFAYISVYEAVVKLLIIFLLPFLPYDRLIVYAILLMFVQLSIRVIYATYSNKRFKETNAKWLWDKKQSIELFNFASWQITGYLAVVGYTQGINILLNIFFGSTVNAARAIATQVQTALSHFFGNFQTAIRPQIIKSYANNDIENMRSLVLKTARLSFMLAVIIGVPLLAYSEYILSFWLGTYPEHTLSFVQITLIAGIANSLSQHTLMAIHATGDIKKFQMIEGAFLLSIVPIAYFLLKFYSISPEGIICVYLIIEIVTQFVRVYLVYPKIGLKIKFFFTKVLIRSLFVLCLCFGASQTFCYYVSPSNIITMLITGICLILVECIVVVLFGLEKSERTLVFSYINRIKSNFHYL